MDATSDRFDSEIQAARIRRTLPAVIQKVDPAFTKRALEAKIEGLVALRLTARLYGLAEYINVIRSTGPSRDEKAIECLMKRRFKPATRDGEPAPVRVTAGVRFRLPPNQLSYRERPRSPVRCQTTAVRWLSGCALVVFASAELLAAPAPARRPDEFFLHPEVLCKALEQYGIHTKPWAPIGLGPHSATVPFDCEYTGVPELGPGAGDQNHSTVFRVSGDYGQRAVRLAAGSAGVPPARVGFIQGHR
jgi:hypothetical protein